MAHVNPKYRDREAMAPYNFVPLADKPLVAKVPLPHDRFAANDGGAAVYTGEFHCELTTETPCFIRGPLPAGESGDGQDAKNKPEFFSIDGGKTPCIPGSSLRGLFRGLVEIVSGSRIGDVSKRKLVYRAVDTTRLGVQYRNRIMEEVKKNFFVPRLRAGYIRKWKDEWYIQPAEEINGTTWCRIWQRSIPPGLTPWPPEEVKRDCNATKTSASQNGKTIYIQPGQSEFQEVRGGFLHIKFARALRASASPGVGLKVAALIPSGPMMSKRSEAIVFAPDNSKPAKEWLPLRDVNPDGDEIALDKEYNEQITDQQRALLGQNGVLNDLQPVFYLVENGRLTFFGHTMMLRLPYEHAPYDLLPDALKTDERTEIDIAEALFGYIGRRKNQPDDTSARAGRVFFSDGQYNGNLPDPFEREIKPQVLSTPKPTTFQHYLEQVKPDDKGELLNYDDPQARIRGVKQYWHRGAVNINQVEETDRKKLSHQSQYTRIRAVKSGARFTFSIRFENLRAEELGALAWVLQTAGTPAYRLKLGMGKPLGMGAVRVQSTLQLSDRQARYSRLTDGMNWAAGVRAEPDATNAIAGSIKAFTSWAAGTPEKFAALPRIRELLAMLSWPGPQIGQTRYMEIEHYDSSGRKRNEYRDRPVLPAPTFVLSPRYQGDTAPVPRSRNEGDLRSAAPPERRNYGQPAPTQPPPKTEPLPEVREDVSDEARLLSEQLDKKRVNEGDIFNATVLKVTANDYECRLGTGIKKLGRLPRDEVKGLKPNDPVRVKVKRIAQSGAAILTVKGVPKE